MRFITAAVALAASVSAAPQAGGPGGQAGNLKDACTKTDQTRAPTEGFAWPITGPKEGSDIAACTSINTTWSEATKENFNVYLMCGGETGFDPKVATTLIAENLNAASPFNWQVKSDMNCGRYAWLIESVNDNSKCQTSSWFKIVGDSAACGGANSTDAAATNNGANGTDAAVTNGDATAIADATAQAGDEECL